MSYAIFFNLSILNINIKSLQYFVHKKLIPLKVGNKLYLDEAPTMLMYVYAYHKSKYAWNIYIYREVDDKANNKL
jgi:hypothetical protein